MPGINLLATIRQPLVAIWQGAADGILIRR